MATWSSKLHGKDIGFDFLVVFTLKGKLGSDQSIEHDSQRPYVALLCVGALEALRCDVVNLAKVEGTLPTGFE
jgi:hypothetical protein